MEELFSNHLKTALFPEDMLSERGKAIFQKDCLTVQHYNYKVSRTRDDMGSIAGCLSTSSELHLSLRAHSVSTSEVFFDAMRKNSPQPFTMLFNATFDKTGKLENYDDAAVFFGYIIDINTGFDCTVSDMTKMEQLRVDFILLISSINFVGKNSNKTLVVSQ